MITNMEFIEYKCLESLLIEGEDLIAEEGLSDKSKENLTLAGALALIIAGLGISYSDWKRDKKLREQQKQFEARARSEADAQAKFKASPEYSQIEAKLKKKYGNDIHININKITNEIEKDISKIGKKINSDKKLCAKWAEEYNEYYKKEYAEEDIDGVNDIKTGPCDVSPEDYCDKKNIAFTISCMDQTPLSWICNKYLFDLYAEALNAKYSNEIMYGLMTKFSAQGDGDEGLIGCTIKD